MSFAIRFMSLLEKYETLIKELESAQITEVFGIKLPSATVQSLTYKNLQAQDYWDDCHTTIYGEVNGEEYALEDIMYTSLSNNERLTWSLDTNTEMFEYFVKNQAEEYPQEVLNDIMDNSDNVDLLLGVYYLLIVDHIQNNMKEEYKELKKEFPNESFYPQLNLNTSSVAYYESSKCW